MLRGIRPSVGTVRRLEKDCQFQKCESTGQSELVSGSRMVQNNTKDDPFKYPLSDSDDEEPCVGVICVTNGGSKCQYAKIVIGGVSCMI